MPLLYVYCDGPKGEEQRAGVESVRALVRGVDWCETRVVERATNLGLGRSILAGVTEVFGRHEALIVFEDDILCVPGTYAWMCSALEAYRDDPRVMSVTGWTHPRVCPRDAGDRPYFDGRAECWSWGTWSRVWPAMVDDARTLLRRCQDRGISPTRYGHDLPEMARDELRRNLWAVRLAYRHLVDGGLCVRPPWSAVEHIGFDPQATNSQFATEWMNPPLRRAPPIPERWPEPVENPECAPLWSRAYPSPARRRWRHFVSRVMRRLRGA